MNIYVNPWKCPTILITKRFSNIHSSAIHGVWWSYKQIRPLHRANCLGWPRVGRGIQPRTAIELAKFVPTLSLWRKTVDRLLYFIFFTACCLSDKSLGTDYLRAQELPSTASRLEGEAISDVPGKMNRFLLRIFSAEIKPNLLKLYTQ